jgi:hypothetical protein
VGAWIQDNFRGIVAGVSFNGGNTWQSVAIPGISLCSGGTWAFSADPWVSFAPNGDVYISALGKDANADPKAVLVNKSTDGGLTWGAPTTVVTGNNDLNDKDSITADPTNSQFVYVAWTRFRKGTGIPMFSRTTDGGQTWEAARELFAPGGNNIAESFQIVVLPDGTLVNVFAQQIHKNDAGGLAHYDVKLSLIRSSDHGQTWQFIDAPIAVTDIFPLADTFTIPGIKGVANPDGGLGVQAPCYNFDVAMDSANGNLYVVWQDTRFSNGQYTSIAFSMSTDGGFTWSVPIKINQTPVDIPVGDQQAFLPSVAVNQDGVVAVTYYDFRNNTTDPGLLTDYWMVHAHPKDGLTNPASWSSESRLTATFFNIEQNVPTAAFYFVGDYEGLVAEGKDFGAFWDMLSTNPDGTTDYGSIFFRDPLPADPSPAAGPVLDPGTSGTVQPAQLAPVPDDVPTLLTFATGGQVLASLPRRGLQTFSNAPAPVMSTVAIAVRGTGPAAQVDALWGGGGEEAIDQAIMEWQPDELDSLATAE